MDLPKVPAAILINEQSKIKNDLDANHNAYLNLQNVVKAIVANAVSSKSNATTSDSDNSVEGGPGLVIDSKSDTSSDSGSVSTVVKCNSSLESIKAILTDDDISTSSSDDATEVPVSTKQEEHNIVNLGDQIPGLNNLLSLLSKGKVVLSEEVIQQLNGINIQLKALSEASSTLQDRWSALESAITTLKKETNEIKQYIKFDNLLLHKFPRPNTELSSLEFSHFIAQQLNYFIPQLSVPVLWHHISDAHPLQTKSKKSNVIIVRFCNRNVRHEVYSKRNFLRGMSITEHLTEDNLKILYRAKELFGFNNVETVKCKVVVNCNGKFSKVNSVQDVNELFEANTNVHDSNSEHPNRKHFHHQRQIRPNYNYNVNNNVQPTSFNYAHVGQNWNNSSPHDYYYATNPNVYGQRRHPPRRSWRGRRPSYSVRNR